jgi:hypothetical protein
MEIEGKITDKPATEATDRKDEWPRGVPQRFGCEFLNVASNDAVN